MKFVQAYLKHLLSREETAGPDTSLFWSSCGRRVVGKTRASMTGKNIWRLCKVYGRIIGYPELKPHDPRHGVPMEVLEQHHDLEQVRALLGHQRIDTTQIYTSIRPAKHSDVPETRSETANQTTWWPQREAPVRLFVRLSCRSRSSRWRLRPGQTRSVE
jgi:site-specific recombinase XerD